MRAVTGRLYADDTIFDRLRGVADSGYATSSYIGPLSGLAFNSGYSSSSGSSFASDPAKVAARKLARALRGAGVRITPEVALRARPTGAETLARGPLATTSQLADATNVPSNNFFAEMLIKLTRRPLRRRRHHRRRRRGGRALRPRPWGRRPCGRRLRPDPLEPRLARCGRPLPAVDARRGDRRRLHPVAGPDRREGTVASRMDGTAAAGRCRTKTGTLTGVSNLSGYCFNRSGKVMIFSILMGSVYDLSLAHHEQDRIAAAIACY